MTERAYAKINLTLDITGKRADGYHELESVMQSVSLYDTVTVEKADVIVLSSNRVRFPLGRKNTCFRAAESFFECTKIKGGAKIHIYKNIPSQAGLGGGSTDAAAVIRMLDKIYNTGLSDDEKIAIAQKIGADVPFCLFGRTAVCRGIGEKLEKLSGMPTMHLLLIKPNVGVSTPEAYRKFDEMGLKSAHGTPKMIEAIKHGKDPAEALSNDLERVVGDDWLQKIKEKMSLSGARAAQMSGSGSCVFGIYDSEDDAANALKNFSGYRFKAICKTI